MAQTGAWTVLPPQFYPGDRAELRISLPADTGDLHLPTGDQTLDILGAELVPGPGGSTELRLSFIVWKPGAFSIPILRAGGITYGPFALAARSYLEASGAGLAEARPPLLLPRTRLMIAAAFAALALGLMGAYAVYTYILPWLGRLLRRRRERLPYRRFRHDLRVALKRAGDEGGRRFYDYLSQAFRRYARDALGRPFDSLGPSELAGVTEAPLGPRAEALAALLARIDRARFAGEESDPASRIEEAGHMGSLIEATEAERAALR
jgi:hypothetical protein